MINVNYICKEEEFIPLLEFCMYIVVRYFCNEIVSIKNMDNQNYYSRIYTRNRSSIHHKISRTTC